MVSCTKGDPWTAAVNHFSKLQACVSKENKFHTLYKNSTGSWGLVQLPCEGFCALGLEAGESNPKHGSSQLSHLRCIHLAFIPQWDLALQSVWFWLHWEEPEMVSRGIDDVARTAPVSMM